MEAVSVPPVWDMLNITLYRRLGAVTIGPVSQVIFNQVSANKHVSFWNIKTAFVFNRCLKNNYTCVCKQALLAVTGFHRHG